MGYDIEQIVISVRLSSHNSPDDATDREALADLKTDIQNIIHDEPDYQRIVTCGPS